MVELSILFDMCFHLSRFFDVQFLLTRVKPLKCNYSSTLVIRGLLEAIAAMMPPQMFQTSLKNKKT